MEIEIKPIDKQQAKKDRHGQIRAIILEGGDLDPGLLDKYFDENGFTAEDFLAVTRLGIKS